MAQKNLLQEGQTLDHDGQRLKIIKRLSSGLTGEVYRAVLGPPGNETNVVVKAMKSLDFPLARQLFYKEGETLAFLMHLEEESKDSLADNLKIAPNYYGLSEFWLEPESMGFPCLIMEFIHGQEVPKLLKAKGSLDELQALVIAWHLYRILDILHTRLLKTYIDLKFEDLWWVENNSKWGGQLRMTDFGTLEEIKPGDEKKRGVARDILLGGVYLLAMLTDHTLEYSIGELKEPANRVINGSQDKTTWGTRRLLKKLLHRNIDARFKSASDVLVELRQLANFWSQPSERLAEMTQKNLATAEDAAEQARAGKKPLSDSGLAAAVRAYSALDILRVKDPERFVENDIQRAKSVLSIGDYFERGYALLQGRSFTLARQTFEEGLLWADDPAVLRRWTHAARIGEDVPPSDFESRFNELKAALDFIDQDEPNAQKWQSAWDGFSDLENTALGKPSLKSKGLDYLKTECELYKLMEEAGNCYTRGKFSEAAGLYKEAKEILDDGKRVLPNAGKLIEDETGNLAALIRNAEAQIDREKSLEQYDLARQTLEKGEALQAVEIAKEAYGLDRDAPFRLEKLTELSVTALEVGSRQTEKMDVFVRASRHFADIGIQEFGGNPAFDKICEAALKLEEAMQTLALSDHAGFCANLEDIHTLLGEKGKVVEGIAVHAASKVGNQPLFLSVLADSLGRLVPSSQYPTKWREEASTVSAEQSAKYQEQMDELLREVHFILLPIMPAANESQSLDIILQETANQADIIPGFDLISLRDRSARLEQADVLLGRATKLVGERDESRRNEIASLSKKVRSEFNAARAALTALIASQTESRRMRLAALSKERIQLDGQLTWFKRGESLGLDADTQKPLILPLRQKLLDFIYRCYQVKSGDSEGLADAVRRQKELQETGKDDNSPDVSVLDSYVKWASRSLDSLGIESWDQIAKLASEQRKEGFAAELEKANNTFAVGDLGSVGEFLDRTRDEFGTFPEWRALKEKLAQALAWNSWCDSKSAQFQSKKADTQLLRDLCAFGKLALPVVYWEKSSARQYLDDTEEFLQGVLQQSIKTDDYGEQFVEAIRSLLDVTWTKYLATSKKEGGKWEKSRWVRRAYELREDKRGLMEHIAQTFPPENHEVELRSFSIADWQTAQREEMHSDRINIKNRRLMISAAIAVAVCFALVVAGLVVYKANEEALQQLLFGAYTPTMTLSPTITFTPSITSTITLTPTSTLTPTPVPPSRFLLRDPSSLLPASPVLGDAYWMVNDADAKFDPPLDPQNKTWIKATSTDANSKSEKFVYTISGNSTVEWTVDVPFDKTGYYQIFVMDTKEYSSETQAFTVLLDQQPAQPFRGTSQVIFDDSQQKNDHWISLGVYQVNVGQSVSVKLALGQLAKETPFAVDRLLIVRLSAGNSQMLEGLPSGRELASLLDDFDAKFYEVTADKGPVQVRDRGVLYSDVLGWNGSFSSRALTQPLAIPIWVEWAPVNHLPAGKYEIYVWMPAQHSTAVVDYALLADGKVLERPSPAQVNQRDHAGVWISLGLWDISEEALVSLRMIVAPGVTGEIGVDAIAIVKVDQ
ncbi:MAG: hypothetical protein HZB18_07680 [Chloroflexi bacterium]|nr:hypothetical protein [Chloroflexota bacterium]